MHKFIQLALINNKSNVYFKNQNHICITMKKILILSANPKNTNQLRLGEEVREIKAALKQSKNREQFEVITESALRVDDLRRSLLDYEPDIVHFNGHGAGSDGLLLENKLGEMQLVSSESLAGLFKLFEKRVECVVLNACYSEVQAEAIYQHIDCVIGMNQAIRDVAAIEFAKGFYDALAAGRSYRDSFDFGCRAIDLQGIPESTTPQIKVRKNAFAVRQKKAEESKSEELRFREVFLNKLKNYWIEEVLQKSLYENTYISIRWQYTPNEVKHSFSNHQEFSNERQKTSNTEVYDEFFRMGSGRTLLILGKPGVGKTTILLKLLEVLIQQIENDLNQQFPVVFNLSSWTNKQKNFDQWLVQELTSKYELNKPLAQSWVKEQQLILLLDGFDEVQKKYRQDCVQKINIFRQAHGLTEIVICSRLKEYELISEKLKLEKAIYLQPLTPNQIQDYLDRAGEDLTDLKSLIIESPLLQKLAEKPLTLSLMMTTYNNFEIINLPKTDSVSKLRQHLFDTYINKMLKRRFDSKKYKDRQTIRWLIWLAQRLKNNQSIFKIEEIQPSWLLSENHQKIYRIVVGLIVGLLFGLIAGIYFIFYCRLIKDHPPYINCPNIRLQVLNIGVLSGLICGIFIGQSDLIKNKSIRVLISGIIYTSAITILFNIFNNELLNSYTRPILMAGMFGGYLSRLIREKIQTGNIIKPEGNQVIKYSTILLGWGIIYVLFNAIFYPGVYESKTYYLILEVLNFVILGAFYGGFVIKKKKAISLKKTLPNEGIRRSIKYTLIYFTIFPLYGIVFTWVADGVREPFYLICIALYVGLLAAMGGNDGSAIILIQHFILRVILWWKGDIPWNYARFLNYATERIFLRKIGGSYIFIHRMLLEHFAQMEPHQVRRSKDNGS